MSGDRLAEIKARPRRTKKQWETDLGWLVREVEQLRGDLIRRYRADIDTDELVRRYQAGETLREIATAYHVGVETVRRRLLKRNVLRSRDEAIRRHFEQPEAVAQAQASLHRARGARKKARRAWRDNLPDEAIIADYLDGCSLNVLGKRYGYSSPTIKRVLTEHSIPLRSRAEAQRRRTTT